MIGQRILGLALGHEALNVCDQLRKDRLLGWYWAVSVRCEMTVCPCPAKAGSIIASWQLGVEAEQGGKIQVNFEQIDRLLLDLFIESRQKPPESMALDMDVTDLSCRQTGSRSFTMSAAGSFGTC